MLFTVNALHAPANISTSPLTCHFTQRPIELLLQSPPKPAPPVHARRGRTGWCFYREQSENDIDGWLHEPSSQAGGYKLPLGHGCSPAGTDHTYSMENDHFVYISTNFNTN